MHNSFFWHCWSVEEAFPNAGMICKLASTTLRVASCAQYDLVHAVVHRCGREPERQDVIGHVERYSRRKAIENFFDLRWHRKFSVTHRYAQRMAARICKKIREYTRDVYQAQWARYQKLRKQPLLCRNVFRHDFLDLEAVHPATRIARPPAVALLIVAVVAPKMR